MPERLSPRDEAKYPKLLVSGYAKTSDKNPRYNCVAWAADWEMNLWWEPFLKGPGIYWPDVPEGYYIDNYARAFATIGYVECALSDKHHEPGFDKIALYRGQLDLFSHVSKQLHNGKWTSKLGRGNDIVHNSLEAFEDCAYRFGSVAKIMRRPIRSIPLPENISESHSMTF